MLEDILGCAEIRFNYLLVVWYVLRRLHKDCIGIFCRVILFVCLFAGFDLVFCFETGLTLCILGWLRTHGVPAFSLESWS